MNWERSAITLLVIILVVLALSGCSSAPVWERVTTETETESKASNLGAFDDIGRALGCVFAPDSCDREGDAQ